MISRRVRYSAYTRVICQGLKCLFYYQTTRHTVYWSIKTNYMGTSKSLVIAYHFTLLPQMLNKCLLIHNLSTITIVFYFFLVKLKLLGFLYPFIMWHTCHPSPRMSCYSRSNNVLRRMRCAVIQRYRTPSDQSNARI